MDYSLNRTADTLFITVNSSNCRYFECQKSFPCGSAGKESTCNAGYLGSIPGLGRSPGEGKGYPLQYAGLENSMDCIIHGVAKSRTQLSNFHLHFECKKGQHPPSPPSSFMVLAKHQTLKCVSLILFSGLKTVRLDKANVLHPFPRRLQAANRGQSCLGDPFAALRNHTFQKNTPTMTRAS